MRAERDLVRLSSSTLGSLLMNCKPQKYGDIACNHPSHLLQGITAVDPSIAWWSVPFCGKHDQFGIPWLIKGERVRASCNITGFRAWYGMQEGNLLHCPSASKDNALDGRCYLESFTSAFVSCAATQGHKINTVWMPSFQVSMK